MFQGNVAVKGIGCRASKKIKKGSLALRESPQPLIPEQDSPTFQGAEILVKAFIWSWGCRRRTRKDMWSCTINLTPTQQHGLRGWIENLKAQNAGDEQSDCLENVEREAIQGLGNTLNQRLPQWSLNQDVQIQPLFLERWHKNSRLRWAELWIPLSGGVKREKALRDNLNNFCCQCESVIWQMQRFYRKPKWLKHTKKKKWNRENLKMP